MALPLAAIAVIGQLASQFMNAGATAQAQFGAMRKAERLKQDIENAMRLMQGRQEGSIRSLVKNATSVAGGSLSANGLLNSSIGNAAMRGTISQTIGSVLPSYMSLLGGMQQMRFAPDEMLMRSLLGLDESGSQG